MTTPFSGRSIAAAALLLALALSACDGESAPVEPPSATPAVVAEPPIESTPISPAVPIEMTGTYVHAPSAIAFPESAAGWKRVAPNRYDEQGNDVGIGYSRLWKNTRCEVTIYVYPPSRFPDGSVSTVEQQLPSEIDAVRKAKQDVVVVGRTDTTARREGSEIPVSTVEFQFKGDRRFFMRRLTSLLTLTAIGRWRVKYRVTTPVEQRDMVLAAVEELVAELGLPPTGAPATLPSEDR